MKTVTLPRGVWRYDETRRLGGAGGFAAVYAGLTATDAPVAVKIFHPARSGEAKRELEFASSWVGKPSRHVIPIHDCGIDAVTDEPVLIMAQGDASLADYIRSTAPLSEREACAIAIQIAEGLMEASGWVHRDLKPPNVIRLEDRWHVADFGIARVADAATATSTMKRYLSWRYAAPEQWNGERATSATDVYALGCVIHESLTGAALFNGPDFDDFAQQHRYEPPPIGAGSPGLQSLLMIMLAKPQAVRPNLADVKGRLEALAKAEPSSAISPLSRVSAAVSEQDARRQAAAERARRADTARKELREHAVRVLRQISTELFERIRHEAPAAQMSATKAPARRVGLGLGALIMSVGHQLDVPREAFPSSGWDVVCWDYIQVEQPGYKRGASLWYVNDGSGVWRWLEVAYFRMFGKGNPDGEPCSLPPGRDADFAAGKGMHTWQMAHDPREIEGTATDAFMDRWIGYLAVAAERRLTRPSNLPEPT